MKKKNENCKYCGDKLEAKTTRREFCSNKCKVYWHRENPVLEPIITYKPTSEKSVDGDKAPIYLSDEAGQMAFPPMPTRNEGEDAFDFAARKNEWKRLYGK